MPAGWRQSSVDSSTPSAELPTVVSTKILRCSSPPHNPVYVISVDPSTLTFTVFYHFDTLFFHFLNSKNDVFYTKNGVFLYVLVVCTIFFVYIVYTLFVRVPVRFSDDGLTVPNHHVFVPFHHGLPQNEVVMGRIVEVYSMEHKKDDGPEKTRFLVVRGEIYKWYTV